MRKRKKMYTFILVVMIGSCFLNAIYNKSYNKNFLYYNTVGQKFERNLNSIKDENSNIKKVPYEVSIIFNNSKMNFKRELLYENNRIYISISDFMNYFNIEEKISDDKIELGDTANIEIKEKDISKKDKITLLRGDLFNKNGDYYMSIFDLCEVLKLNTYWDYDNNQIYISKRTIDKDNNYNENTNMKKGYIRFEDFTAGDVYASEGALEKVRSVVDYMKENNESFSISWIPRYINNDQNIDNDISKNDSIENANFIFTLDYIVNNDGVIGLHGYTHQYKNTNSVIGAEFGDGNCTNLQELRKRVENALIIANELNIPISYWETPHYKTTVEEQKIFEEYFDKIYEPSIAVYNKKIITSKNNRITKYIPTPLGYIDDDTGEGIMEKMKSCGENQEFSFFYHLSVEIKSIDITIDNNGEIVYNYKDSILKNIVNLANKLGYKFSNINYL